MSSTEGENPGWRGMVADPTATPGPVEGPGGCRLQPSRTALQFAPRKIEDISLRIERWARVALAATLVSGVVGLFALQGFEMVRDAGRRVGFVLEEDLAVASVTPGLPGERAGLRPGDRILEIGGRRLVTSAGYDEAAAGFRPERAVPFRVLRGERVLDLRIVPGVRPSWLPFVLRGL